MGERSGRTRQGFTAIEELAPTHTIGYYLPSGPYWIEDPTTTLGYDMADCWASCMIPFDGGCSTTHVDSSSSPRWSVGSTWSSSMRTSTRDTTILRYGPLKMMIEMSRALVIALLMSSFAMPMASGHGANDFSIIMRGSSLQPREAEVMQNDSVNVLQRG